MATEISASLYEALAAYQYIAAPDRHDVPYGGKLQTFDFAAYVEDLFDLGIKHSRFFCDLPFYTTHFMPLRAKLPYDYNPQTERYDFDSDNRLNEDFKARIATLVTWGKKAPVSSWQICYMTAGPDYGTPFFTQMGYGFDSKNYYERADFPEYMGGATAPWTRLQRYCSDMTGLLSPYKARFQFVELYNEGDPGMDELTKLKAKGMGFQFNMPRGLDPATFKLGPLTRIGITRYAFHGVFSPWDIKDIVSWCAQVGIPKNQIAIYTDGATPWRLPNGQYKYTTLGNHQGHYKDRINWNLNAANKKAVIDAVKELRDTAKTAGIALIDFQTVLKWQQYLVFTDDAIDWYEAVVG